jgi:hypothetical protein
MENYKRVCVAAIAAAIVNSQNISSVYDYDSGQNLFFSTNKIGNEISVYDYSRRGYMQGSNEQVYDYVTGSYISIHIKGNSFKGFDYERGNYFDGQIDKRNVSFFDYESAQYYNYFVS